MIQMKRSIWTLAILVGLQAMLLGCFTATHKEKKINQAPKVSQSAGKMISLTVGGRDFHGALDAKEASLSSVRDNKESAVYEINGHKVLVEKTRIYIDKKEAAKVNDFAKKIELVYKKGILLIKADKETVLNQKVNW